MVKEIPHPKVPDIGDLPYKSLHLINPAPDGVTRPFGRGEYMLNPNGSWSSEMATTVANPILNGGRPTNVPTLWIRNGKPVRLSDDEAATMAAKSNLFFPSYDTADTARMAGIVRENNWQNIEPENSGSVPTIWSLQRPTPQAPR